MAFTRVALGAGAELCIANLHATNDRPELTTADVLRAAGAATEWARDLPLLFGGDLNLRPAENPGRAFRAHWKRTLRARAAATRPRHAIDHLLSRDLEIAESPNAWQPEQRELLREGLRLRLSDHAPVQARFKNG